VYIFDENLDFGTHIAERIKAYSMLWLIKRNFKDIGSSAVTSPVEALGQARVGGP